jgi:chemotaxis protein CheX
LTEIVAANSLVLDADLGAKAAPGLQAALLERRGQPVVVDASKVGHIGGGCLQLLLSAKLTWESDKQSFSLVSPSQQVLQALEFTGLNNALLQEKGAS